MYWCLYIYVCWDDRCLFSFPHTVFLSPYKLWVHISLFYKSFWFTSMSKYVLALGSPPHYKYACLTLCITSCDCVLKVVSFIFKCSKAAFMLILRGQNQRFETLIQNADPKRRSREYCLCFPREEDDFVSMHCALFEAIVRAQVNRKGVYMTSFKRGYMWFCVHASTRISVLL